MDSAGRAERGWLEDLRARGSALAAGFDWPTTQEEEWRRTNLAGLKLDELPAVEPDGSGPAPVVEPGPGQAGAVRFQGVTCTGIRLAAAWREQGVVLASLAAWDPVPAPAAALLDAGLAHADNRLAAWHFGALSHGAVLYVPAGVELTEPVFVDLVEEAPAASFPHLAVVLGPGARAVVVLRLTGSGSLVNAGVDVQVGDGASLELYQLQDLGLSSLFFSHGSATVSRDAHFRSLEAQVGGGLVKTRLECSLEGPGAESFLDGAYLAGGSQHLDLRTVQRHRSPRASSRALYKGAVKDSGRTIFQGLIEVSPGAFGTDAYLANRNLILNDGARADSIPSLRIDNNDVRCSHGSTTGRLNPEELFYLLSRGFDPAEARTTLVLGYFEDLVGGTPDGSRILPRIAGRLSEHPAAGVREGS